MYLNKSIFILIQFFFFILLDNQYQQKLLGHLIRKKNLSQE
jgi:hypothetical protein